RRVYTLSLHDALPISLPAYRCGAGDAAAVESLVARDLTFSAGISLLAQLFDRYGCSRIASHWHIQFHVALVCRHGQVRKHRTDRSRTACVGGRGRDRGVAAGGSQGSLGWVDDETADERALEGAAEYSLLLHGRGGDSHLAARARTRHGRACQTRNSRGSEDALPGQ